MRLLPILLVLAAALAGCADGGDDAAGVDTAGDGAPPAAEAGIVTGRLTRAGATQAVEIPIASAGHGRLAVGVVMTTNLPQNSLQLNVTGPGGRTGEGDTAPFLYVFPGTKPTMSWGDPPTGTWTATVELANGAMADFELHWCADSADAHGPSSNFACQRY